MPLSCLDSDLDVLFASSDFGEATGAIRNGNAADPIDGIFDDEDVESQNGEGATIIVHQAVFSCASSKVPGLTEGDAFYIRDTNYVVRFWMDDGTGTVDIHMEKVDPEDVIPTPEGQNTVIIAGGGASFPDGIDTLVLDGGDADAIID